MTTSTMSLPPGVTLGTTPTTLVSALNTTLSKIVGGIRHAGRSIRRVGQTPMPAATPRATPRAIALPPVNPSALDRATTAWVRDALTLLVVVLKQTSVSWQSAARFLGWLGAYAEVGCGMTADLVLEEWNAKNIPLRICGGDYEKYLPAGLELMKQFAGYRPDAELEPIFLWISVVESLRAQAAAGAAAQPA